MGLPPSPSFTFKIPSIHDGTQLSCRLYIPRQLEQPETAASWQKRGAIVAHPYAPLGGCYDDPVVSTVGEELLESGYVVGTFNFRGAGDSDGKTSWTAKPELADYVSFYGLMLCFLDGLKIGGSTSRIRESDPSGESSSGDVGKNQSEDSSATFSIILCGYSYGSMIASHVPTVDVVLRLFQDASRDSFAAAIRSRADQCSAHCNNSVHTEFRPHTPDRTRPDSRPRSPLPVVLGQSPVSQKERKVILEGVRRSLDRAKRKISFSSRSSDVGSQERKTVVTEKPQIQIPRISYLLVSPILPPISQFLTMFSKISLSSSVISGTSAQDTSIPSAKAEEQLSAHPTLVIYGDNDNFTAADKVRMWCEGITKTTGSQIHAREIEAAGHFWHEQRAKAQMKATIRAWLGHLHHDNDNTAGSL
ncbi:Alpha/Beta hydrolase protein [Paecilomyces variotii]|uniref:Alpha/Beta hydrolase protein n=1 Tax=Byssochlamys spectabilis TaxID=264951 RepID=A0A443I2T1_BYSSP|nr:Alpha/Beta hydrolase protein [Paecilomyces variotii]KAJ9260000.1 hypothetical protein DTO207G8_697 [Paecilomyces variotii]KAJ9267387.1 hypothetical protein DTO195F2_620 [Paecilomyces variotii]KAJ9360942.1 hypothetical protein DTO280E4_4153 [Paecilomyces variotii]KAJ9390668.1 hypothetical protein DTO063F5_1618 [Paecilomyces variotii]RWQ98368.1 Alpha/Beta hydrolase protein [Paecilomyces variotii]